MDFEKIGGRRFLFTTTCFATCTVMLYLDKLPAPDFVAIINWIGSVYMGVNTAQKAIEKYGRQSDTERKEPEQ